MATITLSVQGMHCAACVKKIERALGALAGVSGAKVDLIAGKAVVTHDPALAPEAALKDAVRAAGFRVLA
jgi:Cu+-exporting ATPase